MKQENKTTEDIIKEEFLERLSKTGWYPHLKDMGKRSLEEFEGMLLTEFSQAIKQAEEKTISRRNRRNGNR